MSTFILALAQKRNETHETRRSAGFLHRAYGVQSRLQVVHGGVSRTLGARWFGLGGDGKELHFDGELGLLLDDSVGLGAELGVLDAGLL